MSATATIPGTIPSTTTIPTEPESARPTLEAVIQETERRRAALQLRTEEFKFQQQRAKMYAFSGLFGGTKDLSLDQAIAQAMVRIDLGEGMGFSAAESMQGIDIISNRPAISSALRAARMQAAGFSWGLQWHKEKGECAGCTLWLNYKGKPIMEPRRKDDGTPVLDDEGRPVMDQAHVSFRKADAESMKTTIWEDGQKKRVSLLQKWIHGGGATLEDLYFARVITRAQRRYAPAVLSTSILSIEEAMDLDTEPIRYSAPAEEKSNGKGNAGLKESLDIQENPTVIELGWKTADEMNTALRELRERMTKEIGPAGAAEFDRLYRTEAHASIQEGAALYAKLLRTLELAHAPASES